MLALPPCDMRVQWLLGAFRRDEALGSVLTTLSAAGVEL